MYRTTPRLLGVLLGALVVAGLAPALPAAEGPASEPLFSRHVVPLFSRLGCNAGSCHGAVKGQNGFRLSLFGAEPAGDHDRLLREAGGRRLNPNDPENSLLLLKAAGQAGHQGGKRLEVNSPEYRLLRDWIAAGAKLDAVPQSAVTRLTVTPPLQTAKQGETYSLKVTATFADGSTEDVTALCSFEPANKELARIQPSGLVEALAVGDTALVARYRSEPVVAMLVSPRAGDEAFPDVRPVNFIDKHVLDKLRRLNIHPADLCDDATFLRRVSLDVTGALPAPDEIRAFLADPAADKRAKKIEELLARPGYAALWATKFCDILRPVGFEAKLGFSEPAETRRFYEWLRARFQENTPYDQLAERILLATSREGRGEQEWAAEVKAMAEENAGKSTELKAYNNRQTLDLYWQRTNAAGVKGALQVAHAFLGLRLECAQCHRHPHDVWQQDDLISFANFFMRVPAGGEKSSSAAMTKEADGLGKEIKDLKDEAKKLAEQAKDKSLPKEEAAKLQAEAKALGEKATALESAAKRMKGTEIHTDGKAIFASVTSTLGKQDSKQFRLLGEMKPQAVPPGQDPRAPVVAWLKQPENPFFARAAVNRVWAHYFGRGIIDPPDQLSPLNPASHPDLLAELCADFVKHGHDLKRLHRAILNSRTYQQSAQTNATNKHETTNYASFYLRRLPAEILVDAVNHATAGSETYPPELHLPANAKALEVAGSTGGEKGKATLQYAFHIFGRPQRSPEVQCDCERDTKPTMAQTLYLANHPAVQQKITAPQGRVAQLIKDIAEEDKRIEDLFLWALSRLPTNEERQTCLKYVKESASPQRGLEDLLWGLLNTREFLLNH
ncbi:MAG: DUF1553 domain-containing protein [Planctomycetia bacterium]|nr:DUF1553 domain-containing protein [Planctomycetia bacterium]